MRYIWKRCFAALLAVVLAFALLPATALAASSTPFLNNGGTGEENSPYLISTKEQLEAFRTYINTDSGHGEGKYFKLTTNIDLNNQEWTPIGKISDSFKGVFDGAGHTVSGLNVVISAFAANVGMFWYLEGTIKNLGISGSVTGLNNNENVGGIVGQNSGGTIENCHFTGTVNATGSSSRVGGIAGLNNGTISNCYFSGTAESTNGEAGGIAGKNQETIENCYNTGAVTSNYRTGGIAGSNIGDDSTCSVKNCYNTGKVSGGTAGGIVGYFSDNTTIENCYYLDGTADKGIGTGSSDGATAKPADEFRTLAETLNNEYPTLGNPWENDALLGRPVLKDNKETCTATEAHPFEIPDKTTLENFRNYVNEYNNCEGMYFKVTANIDLENEEWEPIHYFYGTFDGGGYTISGLNINKQEASYIGLFQHLESDGTVKNLTVAGNVICESYGAGIVGNNKGTVENCHNKCDISGTGKYYYQGGVVGNNNGTVENCYNTGNISGYGGLGGIVGNNEGPVKNCYNTGNISGNSSAGGIVGSNGRDYSKLNVGTVENCYNSGKVTSSSAGGIVGSLSYGTIRNCYYLTGTADKGIGSGNGDGTTPKTEAEFNSGEVAWLLQDEQDTQVWGQTVGGYPELTDESSKKVYQITGVVDDQESVVWYSNNKATLPAAPVKSGFAFVGWSTTVEGTEADFEQGTPVEADMTVYAIFTKLQPGTGTVTMENYTCGDDSVEPVAESKTNGIENVTYTYTKRGEEAAFVKCGSLSFADLDVGAWYHDYTDYVINHGLMRGTGGLFEPGGTVTRAQMVTVLWNMSGKPVVNYYMTYSDVSEEAWYAEAVRWATSEGIANGYGNGKFGPDDPITREQMAVMLYRYEQKYGDGGFTGAWMYRLPFTDLDQISDWAFEAVAWCNMRGVITGKGNGVFDPKGPAKRGELAAILTRYCGEDDTE